MDERPVQACTVMSHRAPYLEWLQTMVPPEFQLLVARLVDYSETLLNTATFKCDDVSVRIALRSKQRAQAMRVELHQLALAVLQRGKVNRNAARLERSVKKKRDR